MEDLKISQNVAEVYEKQWDVGFVEDVSAENQDVKVKFMGPPYPSQSFKWIKHDDCCCIPIHHDLCPIEWPVTATGHSPIIGEKTLS